MVRDSMLDCFRSHLIYYKLYASFNEQSSELLINNCRVPQGSDLGPLHSPTHTNDPPNISKIFDFYLYADDTNIYDSNSLHDVVRTVNKELEKPYLWPNVNHLSLNIDKTNFIIFHSYNKPLKQHVIPIHVAKAMNHCNIIGLIQCYY